MDYDGTDMSGWSNWGRQGLESYGGREFPLRSISEHLDCRTYQTSSLRSGGKGHHPKLQNWLERCQTCWPRYTGINSHHCQVSVGLVHIATPLGLASFPVLFCRGVIPAHHLRGVIGNSKARRSTHLTDESKSCHDSNGAPNFASHSLVRGSPFHLGVGGREVNLEQAKTTSMPMIAFQHVVIHVISDSRPAPDE